ncbi:MAG: hypothetical protein EOO61_05720 [Hymenobacter sp.]|nr:MAG: hypothetical protein EOO61_05720 [Hymenobacter sp.]
MTKEEELQRYIEERDMLENQRDGDNDILAQLEAEHDDYESMDEWNYAWDEVTAAQNEVMSLDRLIAELEQDMDV